MVLRRLVFGTIALLLLVNESSAAACSSPDYSGPDSTTQNIGTACTTYTWKYTYIRPNHLPDAPAYIILASGTLGNDDYCEAYAGADSSGQLLGRFTGNGETTGPLQAPAGSSIFFSCLLPNTHTSVSVRASPGSCNMIDPLVLPTEFTRSIGPSAYCIFEHSTDQKSTFTFNFTLFDIQAEKEFVSILPSDPDAPHLLQSGSVSPFVFETTGTGFRMILTGDTDLPNGVITVKITSGSAPACSSPDYSGPDSTTQNIATSCPTYTWKYTYVPPSNFPDSPPYIILASGTLGDNDYCEAYAGADSSGQLLGRFTGNGETTGPLQAPAGSSIFFSCQLPNTHTSVSVRASPGDCEMIDPLVLPTEFTVSSGGSKYCIYEHSTDQKSTFTFNFTLFDTQAEKEFVSILPSDPDAPHLLESGSVSPFVFETTGTGFKLISTSDTDLLNGVFTVKITSGSAPTCSSPDYSGPSSKTQNIGISCATYTWKYTYVPLMHFPDSPSYIILASGTLGNNDYCEAYAGADSSGQLLGRFTGNGETTGPLQAPAGSSIFFSCQLPNTHTSVSVRASPGSCNMIDPLVLPTEFTVSVGPFKYCIYEHSTDSPKKFLFNFTLFETEAEKEFVSILPSDPDAPHLQQSGTVAPFVFETTGTGFRLISTSDTDPPNGMFTVKITSEPARSVVCEEDVIIILSPSDLTDLKYDSGDTLYISSSRQIALASIPSKCKTTGDSPIFNFTISECDATYENGGDQLNATLIIRNFKAMNRSLQVQRYISHSITITCDFDASYVVQSDVIMPQVSENEQAADPVSGEFEISLNLYNNEWFNQSLAANAEVTVPDYIFAKVNLDQIPSGVDDYIVQAEQCWATRTDNSSGQPSYPIIEMGCTAPLSESELSGSKEALRNYKPDYATFKLKSFVWTNFTDNQQHIYIHCDVTICQNSTGSCPGQMCTKRKKRALEQNDYQRLSVGPVHLVAEKSQKEQKQTTRADMLGNDDSSEETIDLVYIMTIVLIALLVALAIFMVREKLTKGHYRNDDKHLVSPLLE